MKRMDYFNYIEEELGALAYKIELRGSLNLLDIHLQSEDFYLHFVNLLFDWKLENLNAVQHNTAGIDLVDKTNRIVAQVSATATKQKIESALNNDLSDYKGYTFKFISISKDAGNLRTKTYNNRRKELTFTPAVDIHDIKSLLAAIKSLEIERMKAVYEFLKKELKREPDPEKTETNIAAIINILSKEDWNKGASSFEIVPFDIEAKIAHNQLDSARILIDDHKIYYSRIDKIYSDFDKQGANKSFSVLKSIREVYARLGNADTPDGLFFMIIYEVAKKIRASANYAPIPDEELSLCVGIIVVDAFMRCSIFKNPEGYNSAHP